jgi:hypothetical protein
VHGDVVAALGVSGPTARLEERLDELGARLLEHATRLSALLRGGPHDSTLGAARGAAPNPEEVVA